MQNDELRKLQLCELNILKTFVNICDKNGLKYYLGGGTLLGAIRHKGFIPWDDDVDMYMPREDYEKFLNLANQQLPKDLKLHTFNNDNEYVSYQAVIMDSNYVLKLHHTTNGIDRNAWIDIWPLDYMPKNKISFFIRKYKILYRRFRYQVSVFDTMVDIKKKRPLKEKIIISIVQHTGFGKKSNPIKMLKKLDNTLKQTVKKPAYYLNGMSVYKFKNMMPLDVYGNGDLYQFEDMKVNGPKDYDYFLKRLYGDYMTPPSEKEKNRHDLEIIKKGD